MTSTKSNRTKNSTQSMQTRSKSSGPSKEAQRKGGQHSHSGKGKK